MFYQLNSEEELAKGGVKRMMTAAAQTDDEARALIKQAESVSALQRTWLERETFALDAVRDEELA